MKVNQKTTFKEEVLTMIKDAFKDGQKSGLESLVKAMEDNNVSLISLDEIKKLIYDL